MERRLRGPPLPTLPRNASAPPARAPPRRGRPHAGAGARGRARARPRRALGPADPEVAVRLGGGGRARRVVRRPRGAVAQAAARAGDRAADRARAADPRSAGGGDRRRVLRARRLRGLRGVADDDEQPRAERRLRPVLGRPGSRQPARRRHLQGAEPLARGGARDRLGLPRRSAAAACRRRSPTPRSSGAGRRRSGSSRSRGSSSSTPAAGTRATSRCSRSPMPPSSSWA